MNMHFGTKTIGPIFGQTPKNPSKRISKDCSEIKDTKLKAHISLTFLAKSFINKSYLILISLEYVEHIHLIINIFQYH